MTDRCDVLVVGGGAAGLRAAIAAHEADPALDILLVNKGPLGKTGVTALAFSDRMAFHATLPLTEPVGPDAWKHHARDIYEIGGRVSDGDLAAILARHSAEAFEYLAALGVPWVTRDGRPHQFVTDGSDYARACYTGPDTAGQIEQALLRRLRRTSVRVREDLALAELAVGSDGIAGAVAMGLDGAARTLIPAPAVVLCTGGPGSLFRDNVYPADMTGDGHAAAYRAGAELVNMEFIQIGLCCAYTHLACSGSIMRCVPRFVDNAGEELLPRYLRGRKPADIANLIFAKGATWPVAAEKPTHAIDVAVASEIARRRDVFLDFSRSPDRLSWEALAPEHRARFQAEAGGEVAPAITPLGRLEQINAPVVEWLDRRAIHLRRGERLRIVPMVQHFQGGIKINARAESNIPGLFAAGECAGGQHGANRPGGNALLDTQVFGRIAGESAAARASATHGGDDAVVSAAASRFTDHLRRSQLRARRRGRRGMARAATTLLLYILSDAAGVIRTAAGLDDALARINGLKRAGLGGGSDLDALEALNGLCVAEMILRAALMRDECRGPHLRFAAPAALEPLPTRSDWERCIVIRRHDDDMRLEPRKPVPLLCF